MKQDLRDKIFLAQKFLESHLQEKVTLAQVAKASFLSPFHFHRLFQSMTGLSPRAYFEKIKLEKGAYLLKYTKQAIGDIAFEVGFDNQESFTRSFKSKFRMSPSEFRKSKSPFSLEDMETNDLNKDFKGSFSSDSKNQITKWIESRQRIQVQFQYLYYRYTGPWEKSGKAWRRIMDWGLQAKLFHKESRLVGIWYDDPDIASVQSQRFDLGIIVEEGNAIPKKLPAGLNLAKATDDYVQFPFSGPFSGLEEFYPLVYRSLLKDRNLQISNKPVIEIYKKFPPFLSPSVYETDILIPVVFSK